MTYDVKLGPDGDIFPTRQIVTGEDLVLQRMEIRFRTFAGEYLLDTAQGLPYLEWVQTFPVPLDQIRDAFANEIATCPGVASLDSISATFNDATERVTIDAQATLEAGAEVDITIEQSADASLASGRVAVITSMRGSIL